MLLNCTAGGDLLTLHEISPTSGLASLQANVSPVRLWPKDLPQSCRIRRMRQLRMTSAIWTGLPSSREHSSHTSEASGQTCMGNGSNGDASLVAVCLTSRSTLLYFASIMTQAIPVVRSDPSCWTYAFAHCI